MQTARAGTNPYALYRGLDVLCPLDDFTIEQQRTSGGRALSSNNKISGSARGCGPGGTPSVLSKEKIDTVRHEPPSEVLAEAVRILRADRTGRWHVRAPDEARHRDGLHAWTISGREVERLLRLLWPKYVVDRRRLADRSYGGEIGRVPASWRYALEAALDREAEARRVFAHRREKWEAKRRQSEELRRERMSPEERRGLERKEHEARMRAINAALDEKDKGRATRALLEILSHIRHGRIDRFQHLLVGIAEMPEGTKASDVASIVVPREAHLLPSNDRDRWGKEIIAALSERGFLVQSNPDCYIVKSHPAESVNNRESLDPRT
jgi:hypothetical protein